eukprot:scaffold27386_cov112-Isochrysis_galbana.AAC.2
MPSERSICAASLSRSGPSPANPAAGPAPSSSSLSSSDLPLPPLLLFSLTAFLARPRGRSCGARHWIASGANSAGAEGSSTGLLAKTTAARRSMFATMALFTSLEL